MARIAYISSVETLDVGSPWSTLKSAALFAREHKVYMVLPAQGPLAQAARQAGITPVIIPFRRLRRFRSPWAWLGYFVSTLRASWALYRWLRRENIDLIHTSDVIDLPLMPAARLAGCRVVAHVRVTFARPLAARLCRAFVGLTAHRTICVSRATQRALFGDHAKAGVVMYNSGPGPEFLADPATAPNAGHGLRILAVGKFLAIKGHLNLLELAERLRARDVRFSITIVGREQPGHELYYQRFMEGLRERKLESNFEIVPYLVPRELAQRMDACHLLAHLPDCEDSFPGVVVEAMARQRVVVAWDAGGIGEEFEHGVSGFLLPRGDIDAVAAHVERLARDAQLREQVGRAARSYVRERFNNDNYHRALKALYDDLLT